MQLCCRKQSCDFPVKITQRQPIPISQFFIMSDDIPRGLNPSEIVDGVDELIKTMSTAYVLQPSPPPAKYTDQNIPMHN